MALTTMRAALCHSAHSTRAMTLPSRAAWLPWLPSGFYLSEKVKRGCEYSPKNSFNPLRLSPLASL
eukprot:5812184-Prorocentrum_lima.AAC.1